MIHHINKNDVLIYLCSQTITTRKGQTCFNTLEILNIRLYFHRYWTSLGEYVELASVEYGTHVILSSGPNCQQCAKCIWKDKFHNAMIVIFHIFENDNNNNGGLYNGLTAPSRLTESRMIHWIRPLSRILSDILNPINSVCRLKHGVIHGDLRGTALRLPKFNHRSQDIYMPWGVT